MDVGRIEFGTCPECGIGGGTHRGTCSKSVMRTGLLVLQSQAVMGDRTIDMLTGKEIAQTKSIVEMYSGLECGVRSLRRELLLKARDYRELGYERADLSCRAYAQGLRHAARKLRELPR